MSYLDLPRLHFGGLFFTNPDTINNRLPNYDPDTRLEGPDGAYIPKVAGWNALGVAQLWIEQCTVLSAVGPGGPVAAGDPILGAPVESPSPKTPRKTPDGKGFYDFAKLVDLDPDQQARSAVYGLRLSVGLPGGGGFGGALTVPELQYMTQRVNARTGSWAMVGNWLGHLDEVLWAGDVSSSPFLTAFRDACPRGVAVKLSVDLHQNNPQTQFTSGNLFLYGRVLGSFGPVQAGELAQVWPGRVMVAPPAPAHPAAFSAAPATEAVAPPAGARPLRGLTLDERARSTAAPSAVGPQSLAAAAAAPTTTWSPVPAQVQEIEGTTVLNADLGAAIQLGFQVNDGVFSSDGRFLVDHDIELGVVDPGNGGFRPFTDGAVDFRSAYRPLDSMEKEVELVADSGVVTVALSAEEAALVAGNPLAVRHGGEVVLAEPAGGPLIDLSVRSLRLEQGGSATFQLMARRFGRPVVGEKPVTWSVEPDDGGTPGDVRIEWVTPTDADGLATLRVSATSDPLTLPEDREPLDSLVYFVVFDGPGGGAIGDGPYFIGTIPNLSVLLFNRYTAPAEPTWEEDVGPVLEAYARLYPGMQDKLDIADPATVRAFAPAIAARMALPIGDPAYMPVTRDLSPAKVRMIVDWLRDQAGSPP